jgi:hypothetical protein
MIQLHPLELESLLETIKREYPGALEEFKAFGIMPENSFSIQLREANDKIEWREVNDWSGWCGDWRDLS